MSSPPAYVAIDGISPNSSQSAIATKKTLSLPIVSLGQLSTRECHATYTEATDENTGFVHVTNSSKAVIETVLKVSYACD